MCQRLGTPKTPANPFHAGGRFRGFHGSRIYYGLPDCSPPCTDLTGFSASGGFYFQASNGSVAFPVTGYGYSIDWTPILAGLSPAGMAARLAARHTPTVAKTLVVCPAPKPDPPLTQPILRTVYRYR